LKHAQLRIAKVGMSAPVDISFIVNAHREGLVLTPALRSAYAAKQECERRGIRVEIVLIGDRTDTETEAVINAHRSMLHIVEFVSFGNLGDSRNRALALARGEFVCFLDGDDVWQTTWPAKAYELACSSGDRNTIFHTEVFAGFGSDVFLRHQIQTTDIIFHPLNLCTIWHYCNNLFAHRSVFQRFPLEPYDHSRGYGSEDWHWSCVTLAEGVQRRYVPRTVYFYRQASEKHHLGKGQGLTLKPARLFTDPAFAESYADYVGWTEPPDESQVVKAMHLQVESEFPGWLVSETRSATEFEYELFSLLKDVGGVKLRTPQLQPALTYVFSLLAKKCGQSSFEIACIDCDIMSPSELAIVTRNLIVTSGEEPVVVICGDTSTDRKLLKIVGNAVFINYKLVQRVNCEHKIWFFHFLAAVASQFNPSVIANYNSTFADDFVQEYNVFLTAKGIRLARAFLTPLTDIVKGAAERMTLGKITNGRSRYAEFWAHDDGTTSYLQHICTARTTSALLCASGRRENLLSEMLRGYSRLPSPLEIQPLRFRKTEPGSSVVSCVLNLHREGDMAVPTLRSIGRLLSYAHERSVPAELVVVLDAGDSQTTVVLEQALSAGILPNDTKIVEVANANLGLSRMDGVEAAKGDYIAFMDGDDLYSKNWLTSSVGLIRRLKSNKLAIHPEINIYFGGDQRTMWHADEDEFDVPYGALLFDNAWTSLSVVPRSLLLELPIEPIALDGGFGYEDWHWNISAILEGVTHRTAPQTCHFIRLREESLNRKSFAKQVVVRPTRYAAAFMWDELQKPRNTSSLKVGAH
jgi:glycosyltransferase involved in cell wall biosynthesis